MNMSIQGLQVHVPAAKSDSLPAAYYTTLASFPSSLLQVIQRLVHFLL